MKKNTLPYILILATLLRVIGINQSFWLDEATSGIVARTLNFGQILSQFTQSDFHPPLYYLVLRAWVMIFGDGEIILRTLSLICGVISVYILFQIGNKLVNSRVGTMAALILAVSPLHIYYSQEARMYSLATLLTTLLLYFFVSWIKEKKTRSLVLYSITLPLLFLTDYLPLFIIPALFGSLLLTKNLRSAVKPFILSHLPWLAIFLLYMPIFMSQLEAAGQVKTQAANWWANLGTFGFKNLALLPTKFLIGRISFSSRLVYLLVVLLGACISGFSLYSLFRSKSKYKYIILWLIIPVGIAVIVSFIIPVFTYFRFLFILPVFALLLALGIEKTREIAFAPLFLGVVMFNLVMSSIYLSNYNFHREDWKSAVDYIKANSSDTSHIILFPANSQMEAIVYYWPDAPLSGGYPSDSLEVEKVWLARYVWEVFDPKDTTRQKLEDSGYTKRQEHNFRGVVFWEYEKDDENSN